MSGRPRRGVAALPVVAPLATVLATLLALTGCVGLGPDAGEPAATPSSSASAGAAEPIVDSQFTRDGTFQSHIDVDGVDFVYTLYPTKSTPRTNEWYPRGDKFFSFTFQAYDLDRRLRAPFESKRKVYLDRIKVTSRTVTVGGSPPERPYRLDAEARRITFDPEPVTTRYGMLITSPKGAFELRNQRIRPTALDTRAIVLDFTATVWIQQRAGSDAYYRETIRQKVPIAIFESDEPTRVSDIPINAN